MLEIKSFTLGPAFTNAYLIADPETKDAAVIDPAWDGHIILAEAQKRDWRIAHLWYTHAHFDHFGGAGAIADGCELPPVVAMHPDDRPLWDVKGGAQFFGLSLDDPGPEPTIDLEHGQTLSLGSNQFEVRYAPGHSPGHVMFYCADPGAEQRVEPVETQSRGHALSGGSRLSKPKVEAAGVLFAGDVIFKQSIGRTDLPGGSYDLLLQSIREQVMTLPDEVCILAGHMGETTVGAERKGNPFLRFG